MNYNLHGLLYSAGDFAWMLNGLTIRNGTCVSQQGIVDDQMTYLFFMDDTQQNETFSQDQLYPTLSLAQIRIQSLVTPTPSVSFSVTPTPSRTPAVSLTTTMTPTPSPVVYPNLLANVSWDAIYGSVSTDGSGNTVFTSAETNPNSPVFFQSYFNNVVAGDNYALAVRYLEGTCQYAQFFVDAVVNVQEVRLLTFGLNITDPTAIAQMTTTNSGLWNSNFVIPANCTEIKITTLLYGDPNLKTPAPSGTTFRLGVNSSLIKFVPYVAPTPTPSVSMSASAGGGVSAYDTAILADSPIAYWSLNSGLKDMVNNDTLTLISDTNLTPDSFGNTLSFVQNNTQNTSYAPNTATLYSGVSTEYVYPLTNDYSVETWMVLQPGPGFSNPIINTSPTLAYNNYLLLNEDGTLDTSFVDLGLNGQVNGVLQTTDGKIYLGGDFVMAGGHNYIGMCRLNSDNTVDTTFTNLNVSVGAGGVSTFCQTADGKIYVGGYFTFIDEQEYNYIARLNSDGTLDTTFTDLGTTGQQVTVITQTADGKIYLGGTFSTIGGQNYQNFARLNSDGTLDTTFTEVTLSSQPSAIIQAQDSTIYVGGEFGGSGNPENYLFRLTSEGVVDTTFASLNIDLPVNDVMQAADGHIYVVGDFTTIGGSSYGCLARLNSNGTIDTTFTNLSVPEIVNSVVQVDSNYIYVGGSFSGAIGGNFNDLFRLTSEGDLDMTFQALPYMEFSIPANVYALTDNIVFYGSGSYANAATGLMYNSSTYTTDGFYISGNVDYVTFANTTINFGQTYHIVLSVSDNTPTLYIDGTPYSGSSDLTETYALYSGSSDLTETYAFNALGADFNGDALVGTLGNIAFYNTALSQQQVTNHYNAGKTGYRYNVTPVTPTPTITVTPSITPTPSGVFTAIVESAGTTAANGTYSYTGTNLNNYPVLYLNGESDSYSLQWSTTHNTWAVMYQGSTLYFGYFATPYPWNTSYQVGAGTSPAPTIIQ